MNKFYQPPVPKGFTMVELLVTIVIIIITATLGFQCYAMIRLRANQAVSTTNIRQLAAANLLYAAEHSTYSPAGDSANLIRWHGGRISVSSKFDPTKGYLSDYLGESRSVGKCPEFKKHLEDSASFEDGSGGYGYNSTYIGGLLSDWTKPCSPAAVNDPTRTLMFATTAFAIQQGIQEYPFADPPREASSRSRLGRRLQPSVHFRFDDRALIAWCDGHVSAERSNSNSRSVSGNTDSGAQVNSYGGDSEKHNIGFVGPTANNGWWNPKN